MKILLASSMISSVLCETTEEIRKDAKLKCFGTYGHADFNLSSGFLRFLVGSTFSFFGREFCSMMIDLL